MEKRGAPAQTTGPRASHRWASGIVLFTALQIFLICACSAQEEFADYSAVPSRRRVESQRLSELMAHIAPTPTAISDGPPRLQRHAVFESQSAGASSLLFESSISETPFAREEKVRPKRIEQVNAPARCIHKLFEQQVERTPHAIAIAWPGAQLSYSELNRRANRLAHHLQKRGVGPEVLVGVCLPRCLDMIVAVLGVLKAGGAYLPLDPQSPKERLHFTLEDGHVGVLLTRRDWWQSAAPYSDAGNASSASSKQSDLTVVCLDGDWDIISREAGDNPASEITPANLVYVIYTSGSTGLPKGVLIPHSALSAHSRCFANRFHLGAADRVLQFAPLNFDVSAEEIFPALISGSTVVLRPEVLSNSIERFHQFLVEQRVTTVDLPTSFWAAWMEDLCRFGLKLPPDLRLVIVGSETVTAEQYAQWQRLTNAQVRWCNAYGTTETTITSTLFEPRYGEKHAVVPIGRPLDLTQAYILDSSLCPVAPGASGELHLGGETLARGYLNRPELTASRFIANPFSHDPKARLYKTGDVARFREDGNIEFLGRTDHQVKIRGHRVEPGEIEALLKQHPAVKNALVAARDGVAGEKQLIAYYTPSRSGESGEASVLAFLKNRLPAYMLPSALVKLNNFPVMPNGKLDRRALPAPPPTRPNLQQEFIPPVSPLEKTLAGIWCELLGLDRVGVHDSFFDLGGNSLVALRFAARLESRLGRKLPVTTLFEAPSISRLAERLRIAETTASSSCVVALQPAGSRPPLFLVHGAGGGMLWGYANLAAHLGQDQPLFAFNSRGVQDLEEFTRIEEMAAYYVERLCAFQPTGPYRLGGYCFGGEIAFEMARQLTARGHQVALLALFNAMPPNSSYERASLNPKMLLPFVQNAWRWFHYFRQWTPEQRRSLVHRKWRSLVREIRGSLPFSRPVQANAAEDTVDLSLYPEYQQRLWDIHLRASRQYVPKPYPGCVTLFRTSIHPFFSSFDPTCGWGEFARAGVAVHIMPGTHESILDKPHVQTVAECLNQVLQEGSAAQG
jgi:amino acid adenylation domain-containing protein